MPTFVILAAIMMAGAQAPAQPTGALPLSFAGCTVVDEANAIRSQPDVDKPDHRTATMGVITSLGRRIRVLGRLVPTPNIAAQAGSIDPTIVVMAMAEGDWTSG